MSWIQTYTGRALDTRSFGPDDIVIQDVAHALSNICRFTGHCRRFYSVAEHSVLTMEALRDEVGIEDETVLKWALLHDATEAYLCDIARPVKHLVGAGYRDLDLRLENAIMARFGVFPNAIQRRTVKVADMRMLATEREQIMGPCSRAWESIEDYDPFDLNVVCCEPRNAKGWFLEEFAKLFSSETVHA